MEHIRIFKTKKDYTDSFSGDVLSNYPRVSYVEEIDAVFYDNITIFNWDFNDDFLIND